MHVRVRRERTELRADLTGIDVVGDDDSPDGGPCVLQHGRDSPFDRTRSGVHRNHHVDVVFAHRNDPTGRRAPWPTDARRGALLGSTVTSSREDTTTGTALHASATLAQPTARLDALTGLRWWAAFMVFFYHILVFAPIPGPLATVFAQGYYGVTFFFVLSGFVLTWSARPGVSTSTFYWRRFARIWPSHIVALLIAIPVFYTLSAVPEGSFLKPFDPAVLSLSVVLLQGWWVAPLILFSGNPAAWTLTCEAFFYALHPWISRVLVPTLRRGALFIAGGVVLYAFLYRFLVILWPEPPLVLVPLPVQRVPEFILGMALAWAMRSGWRPKIPPVVGVGSLAGVIALSCSRNSS